MSEEWLDQRIERLMPGLYAGPAVGQATVVLFGARAPAAIQYSEAEGLDDEALVRLVAERLVAYARPGGGGR